jgi:methyl-accepting chemotaxis protein
MFVAYAALERTGWPLGAMVSYAEANTYVQRQLGRTVLIGFIFLVAAFAVGSIVTNRMLVRPVLQLAAAAKKISEGDFTSEVQLQKKDELGVLAEAFRTLQRELGRLIGELKAASNKTADLSRTVYRSSQEISASTEEMAATTSEFASSVQRTSDNVQSIDEEGTAIRQISAQGETAIAQAVNQMKSIEESFAQLNSSASSPRKLARSPI